MGVEIYPVFDVDVPNASFQADGKIFSCQLDALDRVARGRGVLPFTTFTDNRPVPAELLDSAGDDLDAFADMVDELHADWSEWFSPADGIATALALLEVVRSHQAAAVELTDLKALEHSLAELLRCLRLADVAGVRFRLEAS